MEVTWRGVHDAVGMVKENCCEMRCEASKSEARKLDRATFYGVNLSIGAGGSYGEWLRRASILQQASGLKVIGSGVPLSCSRILPAAAGFN